MLRRIFFALLCAPSIAGAAETSTTTVDHPLSLAELIDAALATSLQIGVERARIDEAKALYELAAAQAYPRLTFTALAGGPTPEARTAIKNEPGTLTEASYAGDFNFGQLGFSVRAGGEASVPIYTFGKIESLKDAATHLTRAAGHNQTVTQAEVVLNVTRAFWAYQLTRTFLESLDDGAKTLQKVLEKIEELLEAESPQVTENDRLRLKYALATLGVRRTDAQVANEITLRALRLLLGWDQRRSISVVEASLEDLPEVTPEIEALVNEAKTSRPEVLAVQEVVEAARTFVEFRRARFLPDIFIGGVLQGAYTSNATDQTNPFLNDPYNFFTLAIGAGMRVELDIFTKLAELEQAEAQARVREAQRALLEQAVDFEVRRLHTEINAGYQRVVQLERANTTGRGWLMASALAYDIGTGAADELIDAFLAWAASEADLQKTRFDMMVRFTELARATGRLIAVKRAE